MTAIVDDFAAIRSAVNGAPETGDDGAILALFREWCEAVRYSARGFDEESESEAACARVYGIEDAISDIAAIGAAGLAIKIYIRSRTDHAVADGDPCGLGAAYMEETEASILRDACRFVPELAPLCAAALESEEEDGAGEAEGEADHPATEALENLAAAILRSSPRFREWFPDPLPAMWAERQRLDAVATEADKAGDEDRRDELDHQRFVIEGRIARSRAVTIGGILAQFDLLEWRALSFEECDEDKVLRSTIRGGLGMLARQAQS